MMNITCHKSARGKRASHCYFGTVAGYCNFCFGRFGEGRPTVPFSSCVFFKGWHRWTFSIAEYHTINELRLSTLRGDVIRIHYVALHPVWKETPIFEFIGPFPKQFVAPGGSFTFSLKHLSPELHGFLYLGLSILRPYNRGTNDLLEALGTDL